MESVSNVRLLLECRCDALAEGNEKKASEYEHALTRAKMHKVKTVDDENVITAVQMRIPFGPGLSYEEAKEVAKMETWETDEGRRGDGFYMFVCMRADRSRIAIRLAKGY